MNASHVWEGGGDCGFGFALGGEVARGEHGGAGCGGDVDEGGDGEGGGFFGEGYGCVFESNALVGFCLVDFNNVEVEAAFA